MECVEFQISGDGKLPRFGSGVTTKLENCEVDAVFGSETPSEFLCTLKELVVKECLLKSSGLGVQFLTVCVEEGVGLRA